MSTDDYTHVMTALDDTVNEILDKPPTELAAAFSQVHRLRQAIDAAEELLLTFLKSRKDQPS